MAYSAKPQVFDGRPSVRRTAEPSLPITSIRRMDFQPTTQRVGIDTIVTFVGKFLRNGNAGISLRDLLHELKMQFPHNVIAIDDVASFIRRACAKNPQLVQIRRDAIKERAARIEAPPTALEPQPSPVAPVEVRVDITHPLVEPPASSLAESPIDAPVEKEAEPKPVTAQVQQAAALFFSEEHIRYSPGKIIEINEIIYLMVPIHGTNKTFYLATEYECREALVALRNEYSRAISENRTNSKDPARAICDSIDSMLRPIDELGFFSGVTSISSIGSLVRLVTLYFSDHKHKMNPGGIIGRPLPTSEIGIDNCVNATVRFMEELGTTDIHLVLLQEQFRETYPFASLQLSLVAHIRDRASSKYAKLKDSSRGAADVVAPPQPKTLELNDEQFFELCVAYITEWLSSYALLDSTLQDDLEIVFGRDQRSRIETMFPAALSVVCNTNPDIKNRRETRLLEEQRKEAKRREEAKQYYE